VAVLPGLLVLSCNGYVRLGDYMLGRNWRLVYSAVGDLVDAGLLGLAAVDSCKPGLVAWGDEYRLAWCDRSPRWSVYSREPWRLEALVDALARDLVEEAARRSFIASYVEVKAYRLALREASRRAGVDLLDLGPPMPTPLSLGSRRNRERLREGLLRALRAAGHRI
jgi:hypothetical protein